MNTIPASRTIPALVNELASLYGPRDAVVGGCGTLTYTQLQEEVRRIAARMYRLGVRGGDKVAILMGNKPEWISSALAICSLGATMVALNTWATARELEYLLSHSDARLLIAAPTFLRYDYGNMLHELAPLATRFPMLRAILGVGANLPAGWLPLLDAEAAPEGEEADAIAAAAQAVQPEDIAFLLYTSGSTSTPKGVQLQHYALIENMWHIGQRQHVVAGDRLWLAVSLFWGLGCVNAMMNLLTHGGCIVLQEAFDAAGALRLIQDERCTLFYGTPNMAHAMCEHPARGAHDLSSLRGGMTMGLPEQFQRVIDLGAFEVCNVYGLSETYGNSHITDAHDPLEKRMHSSGRALPGVSHKVVSPDGQSLPAGSVGEIRIKGYVTPGYYKDPVLSAQCFDDDGYFKTGDLGYVDQDGFLYFRGRLKEMVKTGGINVAPAEVESVLMSHPGVHLAQVVGVPDAARDEILAAVIVPKTPGGLTESGILSYCKANLAAYKVPRLLRFASEQELPLTTTGKIQKNRIAAFFFARDEQ